MSRFARERRTFFFEEPSFDAGEGDAWLEIRDEAEQLLVCVPHLREDTLAPLVPVELRALLDALLVAERVELEVLWFYTPRALDFADHLCAPVVVYDCMDELSTFQGAPAALREREAELLEGATLVFTDSPRLYRQKRLFHGSVHEFPSGVDAAHFAKARGQAAADEPDAQRDLPRPRLGFFGVVDERLDLGLIEHLAAAKPAWQLMIIGPVVKIDPQRLPQRSNIHWLGQRSYEDLPRYVAGWDVAIMPFAQNAATRFISPAKPLEYLAAGKPVVSTPLEDIADQYSVVKSITVADRDAFADAVERVLAAPSLEVAQLREQADRFVAHNSWDATWSRMNDLIRAELDPRRSFHEVHSHV